MTSLPTKRRSMTTTASCKRRWNGTRSIQRILMLERRSELSAAAWTFFFKKSKTQNQIIFLEIQGVEILGLLEEVESPGVAEILVLENLLKRSYLNINDKYLRGPGNPGGGANPAKPRY